MVEQVFLTTGYVYHLKSERRSAVPPGNIKCELRGFPLIEADGTESWYLVLTAMASDPNPKSGTPATSQFGILRDTVLCTW